MTRRLAATASAFTMLALAACGSAERTQTTTSLQDQTVTTTPTTGGVPAAQAPIPPAQGEGNAGALTQPDRANAMDAADNGGTAPAEGTTR